MDDGAGGFGLDGLGIVSGKATRRITHCYGIGCWIGHPVCMLRSYRYTAIGARAVSFVHLYTFALVQGHGGSVVSGLIPP